MRLSKFIADCGYCSRRKAEDLIDKGKVFVNDIRIVQQGVSIDEEEDCVRVEGNILSKVTKFYYLLLNKPKGYITTMSDPRNRKSVTDLLPPSIRLFSVGRLDKDSSGLLLFTNDGDLSYKLTHPKFCIDKVYQVTIQGIVEPAKVDKIRKGIYIGNSKTKPAKITRVFKSREKSIFRVILHEGKNRQVRRMFSRIGCKVVGLKRVQYGFLSIKGVKEGSFRMLTSQEVVTLKKIINQVD